MFIAEIFRKCNETTQGEKDSGKTSSELPRSPPTSRKLPTYAVYPNYIDGKFIPTGPKKVLERLIDNYSIPKTSTLPSGSTSTVRVSSATGETLSTKATTKPAETEASTYQGDSIEKLPVFVMIQDTTNQHQCLEKVLKKVMKTEPSLCSNWYG